MISRADEQKILDQYLALLESAQQRLREHEKRVEESRSEVANLEAIVKGVSSRIPGSRNDGGNAAPATGSTLTLTTGAVITAGTDAVLGAGASVRHGLPTLTSVIRQIMADGQPRNADAILAEIARRGLETAAQGTKQQVGNRLVELKKQGYLVSTEPRGFYRLASAEAGRNGTGREGPLLPVQPGGQQSPGEEYATSHPGHPHDLEGAPGVVHRAGV